MGRGRPAGQERQTAARSPSSSSVPGCAEPSFWVSSYELLDLPYPSPLGSGNSLSRRFRIKTPQENISEDGLVLYHSRKEGGISSEHSVLWLYMILATNLSFALVSVHT